MKRSKFDLSEQRLFTADMGLLYPCFCRHVVPGDIFRIRNEVVVRMQPGRAPLMTDINIFSHYFFVPYRILDDNFEDFIRQSKGTRYDAEPYEFEPPYLDTKNKANYPGDVLDFLYKVDGVKFDGNNYKVHSYPLQAYNMVYNEYYRDENLIDPVDYKVGVAGAAQPTFEYDVGAAPGTGLASTNGLLRRAWEKDYFTSALPFAQRGIPPALPIFTDFSKDVFNAVLGTGNVSLSPDPLPSGKGVRGKINRVGNEPNAYYVFSPLASEIQHGVGEITTYAKGLDQDIPAVTFNINDLRTAVAVQHWQELNARFGVRYTELLQAHFGVSPSDSRLDRPEYIGGTRQPLMVSEVLQTSESASTPQGSMTGHGISVNLDRVGSYRAQEYGLIIGIFSILPRAQYMSGIDREWTYSTPQEFYFPDFAYLGEQAVKTQELFAGSDSASKDVTFGYQGRYDELRTGHDSVHSLMRTTYNFWSLARKFEQAPNLNQAFIECNPRKDFLFVQNEPGFIVSYANRVTAIRPMPKYAVPGLRRL